MAKLSEIQINIKNTPPRLLRLVKELLMFTNPTKRSIIEETTSLLMGYDNSDVWRSALHKKGLYPYRPDTCPATILAYRIEPRGDYVTMGLVYDDFIVAQLAADVYEKILFLVENHCAPLLESRRPKECTKDFLLRMQAWCLEVIQCQAVEGRKKKNDTRQTETHNPIEAKKRFALLPGQVCFDGMDLKLSTGLTTEVFEKLYTNWGKIVLYCDLDLNSEKGEASEQLKQAKMKIAKTLKKNKVPCTIENKQRTGYVLKEKTRRK